jgi:hypothetical protein
VGLKGSRDREVDGMRKLQRVECGCEFNADGEMEMVKYCPSCRPTQGVYSCGECELAFPLFEDLQSHVYNVHFLGLEEPEAELAVVTIPAVSEFEIAS